MCLWKRGLGQGLKDTGKMVLKSHGLPLQKHIDELERAFGRTALEVDLF